MLCFPRAFAVLCRDFPVH